MLWESCIPAHVMDVSMEGVPSCPGIREGKEPFKVVIANNTSITTKSSHDNSSHGAEGFNGKAVAGGSSENGIIVVGFIGKHHHDVAHLINKTVDCHVFGSGRLDTPFQFDPEKFNQDVKKWLEGRNLSWYYDDKQGFVYLQYSSDGELFDTSLESEPLTDEHEFSDLQGLLFMFLVCHIVIFIQEGSRFDMQMLNRFRVLQTAKLRIAPFIRPKNVSHPHSSANSRTFALNESPDKPSQSRGRMILSRKDSTGLTMLSGSQTASSPSLNAPVMLFVFLDDFNESQHGRNMEETLGNSAHSNLSTSTRPSSTPKGPQPAVMLSQSAVNSVGGFKKKLQSSLEAQIRFSMKKCRTLSNFESGHPGVRGGAIASSAPLFVLDASRAVSLVDIFSIQSGESLDFTVHLVDEVLKGKATLESLLTGSHLQNTNKEDVASIKDFILRQSGLLRGKGGLVTSSSTTSALGGGIVAAAAAAAASASAVPSMPASSGNVVTNPDLPTFDTWSSYSLVILQRILSSNSDLSCSVESSKAGKEGFVLASRENLGSSEPYELAISHMKKCSGLSTRFSTWWCEKSYPLAREVYLDNLPPFYPSPQHEEHLKRALYAFSSIVKGPSVPLFLTKLQDECTSIWTSGRQLCDAVSLTDKPCIHQRHNTPDDGGNPHSSGYMYLHACACGRSRQLRPDPFDFENANVTYGVFSECDQFLSSIQMPEPKCDGDVQPLPWSLVRIGSAKYYKPSKGLLQSGFCQNQNFLQCWTLNLGKLNESSHSPKFASQQPCMERDTMSKVEIVDDVGSRSFDAAPVGAGAVDDALGRKLRISDINQKTSNDGSVTKGVSIFTMRKPFAEVVAGPAASNSAFRILLDRKSPVGASKEGVGLQGAQVFGMEKHSSSTPNQGSGKFERATVVDRAWQETGISNNFSPANMNGVDKMTRNISMEHATIYVGFEHECPQGHRFILTMGRLKELGSPYWLPEDDNFASFAKGVEETESFKMDKIHGHTNGVAMGSSKTKKRGKLKPKVSNTGTSYNNSVPSAGRGVHHDHKIKNGNCDSDLVTKHAFDGAGQALPLLNRSLPLYMNCPHCRNSSPPNSTSNHRFAGTTSQLQRVFVVTPSYPHVLALAPVIQFEMSCLPASVQHREQKLQFSVPCPVILPPDSFVSLRLPFIYGVKLEDGRVLPLKPFEDQPQYTACIVKGTTLQIVSNRNNSEFPKE